MPSCPPAGRYKVTKAALALVGLIRSSLQEACEAGTPAAVQSGCNAVLDMASLLIAVPQGVHGEQLQVGSLHVASALTPLGPGQLQVTICGAKGGFPPPPPLFNTWQLQASSAVCTDLCLEFCTEGTRFVRWLSRPEELHREQLHVSHTFRTAPVPCHCLVYKEAFSC